MTCNWAGIWPVSSLEHYRYRITFKPRSQSEPKSFRFNFNLWNLELASHQTDLLWIKQKIDWGNRKRKMRGECGRRSEIENRENYALIPSSLVFDRTEYHLFSSPITKRLSLLTVAPLILFRYFSFSSLLLIFVPIFCITPSFLNGKLFLLLKSEDIKHDMLSSAILDVHLIHSYGISM